MKLPGFFKGPPESNPEQPTSLPSNLRDEKLKFKVIIDNIEEGVIMIDNQQTIQLINPGAAAICGWNADEATSININAVIQLVNEK